MVKNEDRSENEVIGKALSDLTARHNESLFVSSCLYSIVNKTDEFYEPFSCGNPHSLYDYSSIRVEGVLRFLHT